MIKKGIYVTNTEKRSGRSVVALGIMKLLLSRSGKVGYFRPIISDYPTGVRDNHIETMMSYFNLNIDYKETYGFTMSQVVKYKNMGQESRLIDKIIEQYKELENKYDVVLVEGSDFSGKGVSFEVDLNTEIAKNLAIPTIIVSSAHNKDLKDAVANLDLVVKTFAEKDVPVQAVCMNRVPEKYAEEVKAELKKVVPADTTIEIIPEVTKLSSPTIHEIYDQIGGEILLGENLLSKQVDHFDVGAMQLRNYLERVRENSLIITPGDRADILMGAFQANASVNYPSISGIVLTGGIRPEPPIMKLIDGLPNPVPIILVDDVTFVAASKIANIKPGIRPGDTRKIELSIATFDNYVDTESLLHKFANFRSSVITPRMFQYNLVSKAKSNKKHIVLPEGTDPRILTAAVHLIEQNVVKITLLGNRDEILAKADHLGLALNEDEITIVDPNNSELYEGYWRTYYELRKHKNIPEDMARDTMLDVSYFGTMMVYKGDADGMVSGAAHTTAHTIIPALQFVKTRPGVSTVSSCFFMCLDDHVTVMGDCAVNVSPNADQLAEIAVSSAESAIAFGIDPKVALLSYSSGTSGTGAEVDKVRAATEKAKALRPDLKIEGPIQYDAAVDPSVGISKMPNSEVAGKANVLVFPDLNTGNNTYKAVQRETGALAIGPMLQGLNKPVNDLSRGCTVDDIFNTVVITAIQAQEGI
ncbi:phosphate acetyltransferase [Maribellus sp. YY47]|uniref:phosphate acetyltransferase n=1 Tax=Maribellus sp. YY47 TaxID=2929486 RepID=UPI0020011DB2|nr:phosphate acetyltransferase [Maribellus sp. YY47]MCK3684278.1 phosphate acetyltransferase [Maribellus sp. YY47]